MKGRQIILFLLFGLLGVFIQGTVIKGIFSGTSIAPNMVLTFVVLLAFVEQSPIGVLLSFLLGLELDLSSASLIGPWAGAFVVIYGFLASLSQRLFVESVPAVVVVVFFSSIIADLIYLGLNFQFRSSVDSGYILFGLGLEALLSAIVAPIVVRVLRTFIWRRDTKRSRSGGLRTA